MPPNYWLPSNKNRHKRHRVGPLRSSPINTSSKASLPRFNNHGDVQNQAGSQIVQGHQIYGNLNIQNGTPAVESNLEGLRRSLSFPDMLARRPNIEQPYPGTCTWILDHEQYRCWRAASHGLLWIKGKPGSGKSTLMSFLYSSRHSEPDSVSEGHIHLDFFFHARGRQLQHSRIGMVRSLLNQLMSQDELVSQHPDIASSAIASYRKKCAAYGRSSSAPELEWEWQLPELEQLLSEAIIEASKHCQLVVFVDALDEAGTEHAKDVAEYLRRINSRAAHLHTGDTPRNLKMCISSRHHPVEPIIKSIVLCMEHNNTKDITKVVIDETDMVKLQIDCPDEFKQSIESVWDRFTHEALRHAKGVFQWVRLVLKLAIQEFDNGRSIENVDAFFKNIPRDLKDLYAYILSSVLDQNRVQESLLLFQWVCFAEDPLQPRQIMSALAAAPTCSRTQPATVQPNLDLQSMTKYIRSLSGGLVELTVPDASIDDLGVSPYQAGVSVAQVVHQTVNEYLLTEGLQLLARRCASVDTPLPTTYDQTEITQQSHLALYECCLAHIEGLDSSIILSQFQEARKSVLHSRTRKHQQSDSLDAAVPFTIYAVEYMFFHARKASQCWSLNDHEIGRLERIRHLRHSIFFEDIESDYRSYEVRLESLFELAAHFQLTNLIRYLISHEYPVNQVSSVGSTPLHVAGSNGFLEGCKLLLSAGADININTSSRYSPLAYAAMGGQHETVAWMLDNGADINPSTNDKDSALACAAWGGHHRVCRLLLDAGANVNFKSVGVNAIGTPLYSAAYWQNLGLVHLFLEAGADVDISGDAHGTALQVAAYRGWHDGVRALIDAGADVNVKGDGHGTALQAARQSDYRREEIVEMLLQAGAREAGDTAQTQDESSNTNVGDNTETPSTTGGVL